MSTPTIRKLWTIYKAILVEGGMTKRGLIVAQGAFHSGACGMLDVLNELVREGEIDELQQVISRHSRSNRVVRGGAPKKRRH